MTLLIYLIVKDETIWLRKHKRLMLALATTLPGLIILPAVFYHGNGPCYQGVIVFNCACPNANQPYWYYLLNWMVPCILLTLCIIVLIVLIERERYQNSKDNHFREEQMLVLRAYFIPVFNFVFLIINIALDSVPTN